MQEKTPLHKNCLTIYLYTVFCVNVTCFCRYYSLMTSFVPSTLKWSHIFMTCVNHGIKSLKGQLGSVHLSNGPNDFERSDTTVWEDRQSDTKSTSQQFVITDKKLARNKEKPRRGLFPGVGFCANSKFHGLRIIKSIVS